METILKLLGGPRCKVLAIVSVWAALFCGEILCAADCNQFKEHQVKAAFVFHFTKFVEWPSQAFPASASPIRIGVFGSHLFCEEMQRIIEDKLVNGRKIELTPVEKATDARGLHLVFIPSSEDSHLEVLMKELKGTCVVTIGETPRSAKAGCMINFITEEDKIRFEINIDSATEAGVKMSAQLQKLAKTIRRKI